MGRVAGGGGISLPDTQPRAIASGVWRGCPAPSSPQNAWSGSGGFALGAVARRVPLRFAHLVVAAAEGVLEPDVEDDEEVAAAHLFHRQLRLAAGAVGPGGGNDGKAVAADDRLQ